RREAESPVRQIFAEGRSSRRRRCNDRLMHKTRWVVVVVAMVLAACGDLSPQERERQVRDHMESIRGDTAALRTFLHDLPKGGDRHRHTWGAITTEKLIQWGAEDGACVNTTTYVASNPCQAGTTPLSATASDQGLYNAVLGAWSMQGSQGPLLAAHQHF